MCYVHYNQFTPSGSYRCDTVGGAKKNWGGGALKKIIIPTPDTPLSTSPWFKLISYRFSSNKMVDRLPFENQEEMPILFKTPLDNKTVNVIECSN